MTLRLSNQARAIGRLNVAAKQKALPLVSSIACDQLSVKVFLPRSKKFESLFAQEIRRISKQKNPFVYWDACFISIFVQSFIHAHENEKLGVVWTGASGGYVRANLFIGNKEWFKQPTRHNRKLFALRMKE